MRRLFHITRSWLAVFLAPIVCIAVLWLWRAPKEDRPLWAKYQQLEEGMTEAEVRAILGRPSIVMGNIDEACLSWVESDERVELSLVCLPKDKKATAKDLWVIDETHYWRKETAWEQFWKKLKVEQFWKKLKANL